MVIVLICLDFFNFLEFFNLFILISYWLDFEFFLIIINDLKCLRNFHSFLLFSFQDFRGLGLYFVHKFRSLSWFLSDWEFSLFFHSRELGSTPTSHRSFKLLPILYDLILLFFSKFIVFPQIASIFGFIECFYTFCTTKFTLDFSKFVFFQTCTSSCTFISSFISFSIFCRFFWNSLHMCLRIILESPFAPKIIKFFQGNFGSFHYFLLLLWFYFIFLNNLCLDFDLIINQIDRQNIDLVTKSLSIGNKSQQTKSQQEFHLFLSFDLESI